MGTFQSVSQSTWFHNCVLTDRQFTYLKIVLGLEAKPIDTDTECTWGLTLFTLILIYTWEIGIDCFYMYEWALRLLTSKSNRPTICFQLFWSTFFFLSVSYLQEMSWAEPHNMGKNYHHEKDRSRICCSIFFHRHNQVYIFSEEFFHIYFYKP